jgi:hypothetical protein
MMDWTRKALARSGRRTLGFVMVASMCFSSGLLFAKAGNGGPPALRGKLVGWDRLMPQVYAEAAKDDLRRYVWREPSPTVNSDFRKLSANVSRDVCVAVFGTAAAQPHEPVSLKVTGGRVTPSTIVLAPGSRISFKNDDPFVHVLYESGNPQWAPNEIAPGSSREWSSTSPGVHIIRDQLFPSVVTYVVIDPQVVEFALPDRQGAFTIPLSAPGEYTVKVFFEGKAVGKEAARVGAAGVEMKDAIAVGAGESK